MNQNQSSVSRRSFFKQSAVAAATVTAFNILPSPEARAAAPIKVGIVGCGGRGRGAAENCLRADEGVKITALADLFPDRMKEMRDRLAKSEVTVPEDRCFVGWDGYQEVLKTDIDYVILSTPPVFRPMMLEAAVKAGKHVFMEKPAAVDAPGIRRIIAAGEKAKEKGLTIVAGSQRRHEKSYVEIVKRLQDGAIGEIVAANVYWCGGVIKFRERKPGMSEMEYQIRNWYHYLWTSGDHIVEQHVHNIDVALWVMGKHPVKAFGYGGRAWQQKGNIWDHHTVDFEFENGVHMSSMSKQTAGDFSNVSELMVGTKGRSDCRKWIKGVNPFTFEGDFQNPYIQEHIDLIDSIRNNKKVNESRNIAISTMTGIMGRMAEYQQKTLTWDEAFNSNETLSEEPYKLGPVDTPDVRIPGGVPYSEDGWNPDPE